MNLCARSAVYRAAAAASVALGGATMLGAQALPGVLGLSVAHGTLKNTARPTPEITAQVDSLDRLIAAATRLGRTAELRRLYAHANALLNRRAWTAETEYAASLVIRTGEQVVDPARRWLFRVEQIYAPRIELARPLTARAFLRQRVPNAPLTTPMVPVKEIGAFDGVARDLRESPLLVEADLAGVPDGTYNVAVEVSDSGRVIGTAALNVVVRNGLDASIARLEAAAAKVGEPVRSDLRFPIDRLRNVNLSRIGLGTFNVARDFAAAESLLTAVNRNRDPWLGRTGDLKRHYLLAAAGEVMPYRLYVPSTYSPSRPMPLIVALHGLGGTEDSFFEAYGRKLPELAEQRGYIVVAPLGYRTDGAYGVQLGLRAIDPAGVRARDLSEQDVYQALEQVRAFYKVDPQRIYLMGHSMGAIGTWALAAKTPQMWTALGAFAGLGAAETAAAMKALPHYVVHGDADATVNVVGSRSMVAALKAVGAELVYIEVPGGNHNNVVEPHLPAMFDFFEKYKTRPAPRP
ncbi:MAG: PHB depolymerase family esterase [Gemmatimonadota bacterium]|nr:PHB depolymerase family esterase [Gemmatimonadota bacterium]